MNIASNHLLAIPALRAAVATALSAGVFYQDDLKAACQPVWDAAYPAPENRLPDVVLPANDDFLKWRARREEASREVASGPRGTWRVISKRLASGETRFETLIADGTGKVHERGVGDSTPSFNQAVAGMIAMEVYDLRESVDRDRQREAAVAHGQALGLRAGITLRNVTVSHVRYSTVVVQAYDPMTGTATLYGTRHGARNRFRMVTSALNVRWDVLDASSHRRAVA